MLFALAIALITKLMAIQCQEFKFVGINDTISSGWRLAIIQDYEDFPDLVVQRSKNGVDKAAFFLADGYAFAKGNRFQTNGDNGRCYEFSKELNDWAETCKWKLLIKGTFSCTLQQGFKYHGSYTDVGDIKGCKRKCLQRQRPKHHKVFGASIVRVGDGGAKRCFCTNNVYQTHDESDQSCYFVPTRSYEKYEVHVGSFSGGLVLSKSTANIDVGQCYDFCLENMKSHPSIDGMSVSRDGACSCTENTQVLRYNENGPSDYTCFLTCQRNNIKYYEDHIGTHSEVNSWERCAEMCSFDDKCKKWSYYKRPEKRYFKKCFLYGADAIPKYTSYSVISGPKHCKPVNGGDGIKPSDDPKHETTKGKVAYDFGPQGNTLIYVAVGIGGLIVFIILVVILVIVIRRKIEKTKKGRSEHQDELQKLTGTNVDNHPPSPPSHREVNGNLPLYENMERSTSSRTPPPPQRAPPPPPTPPPFTPSQFTPSPFTPSPPPIAKQRRSPSTSPRTPIRSTSIPKAKTTNPISPSRNAYHEINSNERTGLIADHDDLYAQPVKPPPEASGIGHPAIPSEEGVYSDPESQDIYYSSLGAGGGRAGTRPPAVESSSYAQVNADDNKYPSLSQPDAVTGLYDVVG